MRCSVGIEDKATALKLVVNPYCSVEVELELNRTLGIT